MDYVSTRGRAPHLSFSAAMLKGLASDGGLYVPTVVPFMSHQHIADLAGVGFCQCLQRVVAPYIGEEFEPTKLSEMIEKAYEGFTHKAMCPLVQIDDNLFVMELFHGPTLAFKDVAMQLLGQLMSAELKRLGRRATIVGATSGDTGAAAIAAFAGLPNIDIFILYPHQRVSPIQRRQMTTVDESNVHVLAVDGNFDDCQDLLKRLFNHHEFAEKIALAGVNSINWARVMVQMSYYFTAAVSLGAPFRPVSFAVPSGNFGNVLAGYYAKKMGLPIERLVVASNDNDILTRAINNGDYSARSVQPTPSPSMDIQVSSNFERLLFEAQAHSHDKVVEHMKRFEQTRSLSLPREVVISLQQDFDAVCVDVDTMEKEIAYTYRTSGMLLDPHSAIGVVGARRGLKNAPKTPVVVAATAHPAKFPHAVQTAVGVVPNLPDSMNDLMQRHERVTLIDADLEALEGQIKKSARIFHV